jgi:diguanylate cyclase (GGDEF)-like protein
VEVAASNGLESGQLSRYAEDFGMLYSEYLDIRTKLDSTTRDANHDPLTGLPNRLLCKDRLQQAIARARREGGTVGLLFVDLDRFKEVNDTLGHAIGDRLLIEFSQRIVGKLRDSDSAARLGGDEFVVIAPGVAGEADLHIVAGKIIDAMRYPFLFDGHEIYAGISIGIALFPGNGDSAEELLRQADMAMYAAKAEGGNVSRLYDVALMLERNQRLDMEAALRQALSRQQMQLAYQPQVSRRDGGIVGVEALLRWHWPEQGEVPPDRFVPLAETAGLMLPIGEWMLRAACAQQAEWRAMGLPAIRMAVNITLRQLCDMAFPDMVAAVLGVHGTPPEMLEIEISEAALMKEDGVIFANLERLRALGVTVAVDDFGVGSISLGRLVTLPVDRVKVGKPFVAEMHRNTGAHATVHAIVALANALNLEVLADGVEHLEQAQLLNGFACSEYQGHLYGRPQSAEAVAAQLARQKGEMT